MIDKPALRARLRAARDGFAPDRAIIVPEAFGRELRPGLTIASYIPIASEADPAALVQAARDAGCSIALPHVSSRAGSIRFLAWDGVAALSAGPFGLRQPAADAVEVNPDIILTPVLGFDRAGNRLGQGAGHYDRAFATLADAWRIGVAWSIQQVDDLTVDPWDVPLHAVVTEQEWIVP